MMMACLESQNEDTTLSALVQDIGLGKPENLMKSLCCNGR